VSTIVSSTMLCGFTERQTSSLDLDPASPCQVEPFLMYAVPSEAESSAKAS